MAIVRVQELSKRFRIAEKQPGMVGTLRHLLQRRHRWVQAVEGLTFSIELGEMVGFLGPNGAGKTTTLKMLSGLIHPSSGEISVAGFRPQQRHPHFLAAISLVMGQKQQLLWDLPPLDSLRVNAAIYGLTHREAERRIAELAEMLELDRELQQPVRKLSLGQRMKAELLAALLHQPQVLFLDEPTLGLDVNAQVRVRQFLADYNRRTGATVLLTSHYMADITALCPRVLLIHGGKLIHDGSLNSLTTQLAPCREVRLELEQPLDPEQLRPYGQLQTLEGRRACLLIDRRQLTAQVSRLLEECPVVDLEIRDPPIEELIGQLFQQGKV